MVCKAVLVYFLVHLITEYKVEAALSITFGNDTGITANSNAHSDSGNNNCRTETYTVNGVSHTTTTCDSGTNLNSGPHSTGCRTETHTVNGVPYTTTTCGGDTGQSLGKAGSIATASSWTSLIQSIPSSCRTQPAVDLFSLVLYDSCKTIDQVFSNLVQFHLHGRDDCRRTVIQTLAERFNNSASPPSHCKCTGPTRQLRYHQGVSDGTSDYKTTCYPDSAYKAVFDKYLTGKDVQCTTHHTLWQDLHKIQETNPDCQRDIIHHISYSLNASGVACSCDFDDCSNIPSYQTLESMTRNAKCISGNKLWGHMNELIHASKSCYKQFETQMSQYFNNAHQTSYVSDDCTCHETTSMHNIHRPGIDYGEWAICDNRGNAYDHMVATLYTNRRCYNQNYLWTHISTIQDNYGRDCTHDFIIRAMVVYADPSKDPCVCQDKHPTTTTTTTTTTTPMPTTTTIQNHECGKFSVIGHIAEQRPVDHPDAQPCDSVIGGTNEALVLATCNISSPSTWSRGQKVMDNCEAIPHYTPIATFEALYYHAKGAESGVFIECTPTGFKMAVQFCNEGPKIIAIETGGLFNSDPDTYYTVL